MHSVVVCAEREERRKIPGEKIRASRSRTERILLQRAQQLKYSGVEGKGRSARCAHCYFGPWISFRRFSHVQNVLYMSVNPRSSRRGERKSRSKGVRTQKQTVKRAGRLPHECPKLRLATQKLQRQRKDESPTRFQVAAPDSHHFNLLAQCQIRHLCDAELRFFLHTGFRGKCIFEPRSINEHCNKKFIGDGIIDLS